MTIGVKILVITLLVGLALATLMAICYVIYLIRDDADTEGDQ